MIRNKKPASFSGMIVLILVFINAVILKTAFLTSEKWYCGLIIFLPLLIIALRDTRQKKHVTFTFQQELKQYL